VFAVPFSLRAATLSVFANRAMASEEIDPSTMVRVVYTTSILIELEGDLEVDQVAEKVKAGEFTVIDSDEEPTKEKIQEVVPKAIADENYDDIDWSGTDYDSYPLWIDGRPYTEDPSGGRFDKD
jgi:hypothetical protein